MKSGGQPRGLLKFCGNGSLPRLYKCCCCCCTRTSSTVPSPLPLRESGTCYHRRSRHCRHCRLSRVHSRRNCFADRTTTHTSGNSSVDASLIRDIYCGPEVLFETCVTMKFVDDDDDRDDDYDDDDLKALTNAAVKNTPSSRVSKFFVDSVIDLKHLQ